MNAERRLDEEAASQRAGQPHETVSPTSDIGNSLGAGQAISTPDQLRERCLELFDRGFSLFPVGLNDRGEAKKPLIKGYHEPAVSARVIKQWPWHRARALGWSLPVGVLGLDVDVKNGRTGLQDLQWLEDRYGALPHTASQTTPSGGFHRLLTTDAELIKGMAAHPRVSGGRVASIDLARRGRLFLRVYDEDFPLMDIAELPAGWVKALMKAGRDERAMGHESLCTSDTAGIVEAIRSASENRNDTLYRGVGAASCQGLWTPQFETRVEAAAREVRLGDDEIICTVESARSRFVERAAFAEKWLTTVKRDESICSSTVSRRTLMRVAGALADRHVRYGGRVGMSVREASTQAGVGKSTAHARLADLHGLSYVQRHGSEAGHQMTYTLRLPHRYSDTSTAVGSIATDIEQQPPTTEEVSESAFQNLVRELGTHDLFLRVGHVRGVPAVGAEVLAAVVAGASTISGISEMCGLSAATVRKYLRVLDEGNLGLLAYRPRQVPVAVVVRQGLPPLLDAAATRLGVTGVGAVRSERYRLERASFARRRSGGSDVAIMRLLNRKVG